MLHTLSFLFLSLCTARPSFEYYWQVYFVHSSLGRTKVLYATSFVLSGAKAKFLRRKPSVLVALEEISEMCWPHSILSEIDKPRYFADWTFVKGIVKEYLFVMLIPSHSHRVTFGHIEFICQSASHCPKLVRSYCRIKLSWIQFMFLYRTQSSANRRTEDLVLYSKSCIKIRNRIGPKTDLCGTLDNTGTGSEAWPSKTTCWVRPESHELIHLLVDNLIP